MPLINSLNDDRVKKLKNLKYPGRAPYIKKDINNPGPNSSGQLQARAEDVVRLANMITDTPGVSFLANQALLENGTAKATTLTARAQEIAGGVLRRLGTIAKQIPVNGTGTHFSYVDNKPELTYFKDGLAAPSAIAGTPINRAANTVSRYEAEAERLKLADNYKDTVIGKAKFAEKNLAEYKTSQYVDKGNAKIQIGARIDSRGPSSDPVNMLDIGKDISEDAFDLVPVKVSNLSTVDGLLVFRGFISNLSDNFNGEWNGTQYVGRMEKFFTYTGFNRSISFSLTIPVFSVLEQPIIYKKLNSLVSYTAPSYKNSLAQGSVANLQIGDYITTAGIFNSINLTYANDVPWGGHELNGGLILPQVITVQINFTPIHSAAPEYTAGGLPYIANSAKGNKEQTLQYFPTLSEPAQATAATVEEPSKPRVKLKNWNNKPKPKRRVKGIIEVGDGHFDDIDNEFITL